MPRGPTTIQPGLTFAIVVSVIALGLWSILNIMLVNFYVGNTGVESGGDSGLASAALNALLALATVIFLWLSLALLQCIAYFAGTLSGTELAFSLCLLVLSAIAALEAQSLLTPSTEASLAFNAPALWQSLPAARRWPQAPWAWPLLEPALAPPLFIALGFWALSGNLRSRIPFSLVRRGVWIVVGALSLLVFVL